MTNAERKLWKYIRNRQINGIQFYRQKPIGKYIVDFYAPDVNLVVEVDGGHHYSTEGKENDDLRDTFLRSAGIRVLRYSNRDVIEKLENVIADIKHNI